MSRNWKRGRGQQKKCFPDSGERVPSENQRYSSHRSFSKGREVDCSDQEYQSLHHQRRFTTSNYSRNRSFNPSTNRSSNYRDQMSLLNNNFVMNDEGNSSEATYPGFQPSTVPEEEQEPTSLLDAQNIFLQTVRDKKPSEWIIEYRKKIDELSQKSTKKNLENVEKMLMYQQKGTPSDVFDAHINNLHLQREEFENFVTKAKTKLSSLTSRNVFTICSEGHSILESVKSECKLFDKVLPGYSLKSSLLSKLKDNQVVIVSSDPQYYANVLFPILLKGEYPHHLLLSCETNELLSSSLRTNVNNLCPKGNELDSAESNMKFFTVEELLKFILKDPKIVNREKDFISICCLPLKRTIVMDILLAKLRDVLEDQSESKLILLLTVCDKSMKYESYFSDFEVDVFPTPSLTFPVSTIWRDSPLVPTDDYIDDIVKTIISIHTLNENGDILIFLPSIPDVQSASVTLREKLLALSVTDLKIVLLHEKKTQPEQMKWLNMCYKELSQSRIAFLVTDCAESFLIPSVSYVVDCGLKKEHLFDPSKKLDVLTTHFISCDEAKLRKKIAGAIASNAVCYRLYNKENFREDMPASEYPELLAIDPFNALIKVFQHEPYCAANLEFVENLPSEIKSRALNLLKKSNAVKDNKLTALGERIIKLPFPPLYSKLLSVGIEWELGYEVVILVAFLSVKGRLFKFYGDPELQRKVDAVKCQLIQGESDTISYLHIYKLWLENKSIASWCDKMHLNYDTLKLVHAKVGEICHIVEDSLKKNIVREFKSENVTESLLELLFECFKMNLCVFTGHYRSGYRMLSSRCISFLHPSSIICQTEKLPQFIIFDHMSSTTRDFLVNITAIPPDLVVNALTEQSLDFDYSDMFEKSLVEKVIEPVGERMIKQVLLGKKGQKLKEIENKIRSVLSDESIVIDPSLEKGRISVFASDACIDEAVKAVEGIIKQQYEYILSSEETHVFKMVNGNVVIPIELKWLKGGIIKSLMVKINDILESKEGLCDEKQTDHSPYSIKKSINITSIRRKCCGTAVVKFSAKDFMFARRFAMKTINLLGAEVFVDADQGYKNNILTLLGIPPDVMQSDVESSLNKLLPPGVTFEKVELKYEPPFETSPNDLLLIKQEIEDACGEHTQLVDFKVVMNMPKPSATLMKAYINVSNDEDIVMASDDLSHNLKFLLGVHCEPVFSTVIKSSFKIINALKPRFEEKLIELEEMIDERFDIKDRFKFNVFPLDDQFCSLKMSSSHFEILQALQRTVYSLLEGDILDHSFNKDIGKLLCHGGLLQLKTLEEAFGVHIVCDYKTKSIRLFGSKKKCHTVKQNILNLILDIETEATKEISLATKSNNRILLKTLLVEYGADLENFISSCGLRLAVLNFKSCTLTLHGNEESILEAENKLKELASSIDLDNFSDVLDNEEVCPVCVCRAQNLTHRLEICGHLYCFECLHALVLQAQFPIICSLEGCNKELILEDISKALEYNQAKLDALLEKSMKKYLEDHRVEYFYCPSPDCSMFFKRSDFSKSKHTCPLCLNDICFKCNVVYHQGYSCEMYQGSKNDPDYSFKIWQQESPECKQCPKCRSAIQKDGGCDHMICKMCNSHFCWICVQEFPTGEAVYQHIPYCPKHPKW